VAFEFKRNPDDLVASHEINVTPFIDVMLVLLVIFMVTAPLSAVHVPLELPVSTAQPQEPARDPVVLSIQQDLALSLGDTSLTRADLRPALDRATHSDHGARIFLRADQSVKYGDLMEVMNLLRDAGYLKVALVGREAPARPAAGAP
jgi:biopolymer transport protein ExbD